MVNLACTEISNRIQERTTTSYNYAEYENNSILYDKNVLDRIKPYDEYQEFIPNLDIKLQRESDIINKNAPTIDYVSGPEPQNQEKHSDVAVETVEETSTIKTELTIKIQEREVVLIESVVSNLREELSDIIAKDKQSSLINKRREALQSLFDQKLHRLAKELRSRYNMYTKRPFCYPEFTEEWKKFYLKHSYDISIEPYPHQLNAFNYIPEWNRYWINRIKEMHDQEYETVKQQLYKELNVRPINIDASDDSEIKIVEHKRHYIELSDISEDEDFPEPEIKRPKKPDEIVSNKDEKCEFSEIDRLKLAVEIAKQIIQEGKEVTDLELEVLLKARIDKINAEKNLANVSQLFCIKNNSSDLSNDDLKMLYREYDKLKHDEREHFLSVLQSIGQADPVRSKMLEMEFSNLDKMKNV